MHYRLFALLLLALPPALNAQSFSHNDYDWEASPKRQTLSEKESLASAVRLLNRQINEYVETEEGIDLYYTEHMIVRVNESRAVDENNKVFIPMQGDAEIVVLKARSIDEDGTITELNQDNIRDISNYEEYGNFKIFALEGAKAGSDLEYLYTLKKDPDMFGREIVQTDIPVHFAEYRFISPERLVFAAQSYNGLPEFTVEEDRLANTRTLYTRVSDVPAATEELYSLGRANLMKFAYKLDYVYYENGQSRRFHTWAEVSRSIYERFFPEKNAKSLAKIIKKQKFDAISGEEQIKAVEQYFKTLVNFNPSVSLQDVDEILQQKYADENGMTRLFLDVFDQLGITVRLVVTSNRYQARFDKDFEDFTNLDEFLIYFPEYDTYLAPGRPDQRYGYAPHYLADNHGLYIASSEYTGVIGSVKYVPLAPRTETTSSNDIKISFDPDMEFVTVDRINTLSGYRTQSYRAGFDYSDDNGRRELLDFTIKSGAAEAEILESSVEGEHIADIPTGKPLVITSKIKASSLLENAGDSYLLNVGMVIGEQSELYQEAERVSPIEMDYPMTYHHVIRFNVPQGYNLAGLEEANLAKYYKEEGEIRAQFVARASREGDTVTIDIVEFYNDIHFDKERYEEFREVINAAADFNKVVLVLEEK